MNIGVQQEYSLPLHSSEMAQNRPRKSPGAGWMSAFSWLAVLRTQKRRGLLRAFSFLASACHSLGRNRRIIRGKFDSDARSARIPCRFSRASAADEGVQHRPAFRDHFHKFPQELNGLARQVVLFLMVHRMRVQPGQAPGAAVAQPSLACLLNTSPSPRDA